MSIIDPVKSLQPFVIETGFLYMMTNVNYPNKFYLGYSANVPGRLRDHNKYLPTPDWHVSNISMEFKDAKAAKQMVLKHFAHLIEPGTSYWFSALAGIPITAFIHNMEINQ